MATIATPNLTTISAGCPAFPDGALAITPSDSHTFASPVSVYVGVAGNVSVDPVNGGSAVVFVGLPAGSMVPCRVNCVNATGTTATNLIAVY